MPYLQLDDQALFFDDRGAGETILFLHGLGSSSRVWRGQLDALSLRHRVVALDTRGSGRSHAPAGRRAPLSIARFADDAAALLRHLGVDAAHVVGLSMGGMIAFEMALRTPSLLRSMTIVNSGPDGTPGGLGHRVGIAARDAVARLFGPGAMGMLLAPMLFPRPSMAPQRRELREQLKRNDADAYRATVHAILEWSVVDRLEEIATPTLVVASERDYTPVEARYAYARRLRRGRLAVVRSARHALPMESPERFNALLEGFVDEHRAR